MTQQRPPLAPKRTHHHSEHGIKRPDPWHWLRDDSREDAEVLAHLERENAYTLAMMAPLEPLQKKLFEELCQRLPATERSAAWRLGDWWYFSEYLEGLEYPRILRYPHGQPEREQLLLDANQLAEGYDYFALGEWAPNLDQNRLAFTTDTVGRRLYRLFVLDLDTGELIGQPIEGTSGNIAWAGNDHLFYVLKHPETLLPWQVYRHHLGDAPDSDVLVHEETDERFYTGVANSRQRDWVMIEAHSTLNSEVHLLPANNPEGQFQVFLPRQDEHEYQVELLDNTAYVLSNRNGATNFALYRCPLEHSQQVDLWQTVVAHRDDVLLEGFEVFRQHLLLAERDQGLQKLRVCDLQAQGDYLSSDEPAYQMSLAINNDPDAGVVRYRYQSLTTPPSVIELDLENGERRTVWQQQVGGGFSPQDYRCERIWVPVRDGTEVPVSLLVHRQHYQRGHSPLYLYAYGSYGISSDPHFSASRLSLVDRGMAFAIAHIRGGQELGRPWYEAGRQQQKWNTYNDFIDVSQHLIDSGWVSSENLVAMGGSAGGKLMGVIANERPELYTAIVAHVPFVDVVTTMLDESLPLTIGEYDEWGNPNERQAFDYMLSYSPYDNVRQQPYPRMLVTTGLHDSQVQYWEPVKWVARLRHESTGDQPILLHINMEAGHGGRSGRFQRFHEVALEYAFVLDAVELVK